MALLNLVSRKMPLLSALFSIRPEYVKQIFAGKKQVEFRKKCCKRCIDRILIYETKPICKIVGEVGVSGILKGSPLILWEMTSCISGITQTAFEQYFAEKNEGFAYMLQNPILYPHPVSLTSIGITAPPQSYFYLSNDMYTSIIALAI